MFKLTKLIDWVFADLWANHFTKAFFLAYMNSSCLYVQHILTDKKRWNGFLFVILCWRNKHRQTGMRSLSDMRMSS